MRKSSSIGPRARLDWIVRLGAILLFLGAVSAAGSARAGFIQGDLFLSSSRTDEVRIYDSETLAFKGSFGHAEFAVGGTGYQDGPNGLAFNARGNLVVAARNKFVEFSEPGVEYAVYDKAVLEPNEVVLFDNLGNMYTTTSTGGSDQLNQYRASDYQFVQSIALPPGAGQLTGITFDDQGRLFVASQSDDKIHVLQASPDFSTFAVSHSISEVNAAELEGLQINQNGELIAAGGDIVRYDRNTGAALGSFDAVPDTDAFPVPLTVDNLGRIYVADFENGFGTASADIYRFAPDGTFQIGINDPGLFGPFGLAVAGTGLPGGPPTSIPEPSTLAGLGLGLAALAFWRRRRG